MMRTRRRLSRPLNKRKAILLRELMEAYAKQKDSYLVELAKTANWYIWQSSWKVKRAFGRKFSHHTLPVHIENECLFDAIYTMISWLEIAKKRSSWKSQVFKHTQSEEVRIKYFKLFKQYGKLAKVLSGEHRDAWLFHLVVNSLKRPPRINQRRITVLDGQSYRVFVEGGKQYVSVTTLHHRQRVVIPLLGNTEIRGNIWLVDNYGRFEIHTASKVKVSRTKHLIKDIALDAGTTEVFTDQYNQRHGKDFGRLLAKVEEVYTEKGRRRSKIRTTAEKIAGTIEDEKDRSAYLKKVRRNNLGKKKQIQFRIRSQAAMATVINHALNQVLDQRPENVIMEDLSQMSGRAKNKKLSRRVTLWMRGTLHKRADFKITVGGSRLQAVASAYTSQECSHCGFTAKKNRKGDRFRCKLCGTVDTADGNAAKVILKRFYDPEIKLWMSKFQIKRILDRRNAEITGAVPDAGCEVNELVQSFATVNGQTPT